MSAPDRLIADTSVLITPPSSEEVDAHGLGEAEQAISAISLAELHKGVLLAADESQRAARLQRLAAIEARHEALPLAAAESRVLGRYMAEAKREARRVRVRDAIIAATAKAHDLAVISRDSDFEHFDAELVLLDPP